MVELRLEGGNKFTCRGLQGQAQGERGPSGIKQMPQLRFSMRYDVNGVLPDGWSGDAPLIVR